MASETDQSFKDLSWFIQAIKDPQHNSFNLQTLSFSSSGKTTHCQLLTSTSMNINVTRANLASLSQIFIELATSLENQTSLRNLEFEGITWSDDIELLQSLGLLLDNASTIKHLSFRKNRFNEQCMNELSEILRRNSSLKEVMFVESRIGSRGATFLASALQVNNTLEELQIWEDSIGCRGAEELSKMIETNSSLKIFSIFDSNPLTATPLISAVLGMNRETEVHVWSGDSKRDGRTLKVVEFLPESNALRIYQIDVSGSCRVAAALGMNTTVRSLDMTGASLNSRWAKEFRWVLEQNRTLREVKLSKTGLKDKAVVYVAAGLFKNKSLQSLYVDGNRFGSIGVADLLCPLSRFSALQLQANITLKTVVFGGSKTKVGRDGLTAILKMLTTNETVVHLGIHDDASLGPDDFVHIFKSLQKNASLRRFSLQGCRGVRGDRVLEAITETLQVNPLIEEIDLARTPLQDSGKADEIYQKLGHNGRNIDEEEEETDSSFRDMPLTEPKSVRAFLCGQDYAGKTTLCNSIMQHFSASGFSNVRTLMNPVEQAVKTAGGMKIKTFMDEDTKISMWNLAGQHEFFALHDLMFPSPCLFLIILSLFRKPSNKEPKTPAEVEGELQYWLRFIVTNSRKAVQQCMKPNVTLVLTHSEKINQQSESFQANLVSIQRQRDKFQDLVDFFPTVFTVDARSSSSVSRLTHHIRLTSKGILQRVPRVYQLCNDMVQLLSEWRSENSNRPVMRWKAFGDLCQYKVPSLKVQSRNENTGTVETRRRAIATCLHQTGEVIYFDECGILILDYEWFCGEVLAQLVKLDSRKQSTGNRNGFVSKKEMEKILKSSLQSPIPGMTSKVLEHLDVCDLVRLMKKLELCYEEDPSSSDSSLLVPSILEDGRVKTQKWQINNTHDCVYSGRHLQCDDSSHMFLTAGFFPRLQVHLHNRIMELKNQHGATYSLEKYLIDVTIQGINIRVELGGQLGDYVDVLACSTKSLTETLRLINQLIIPAIQNSCHGVILLEHIIRPQCVQDFTPPRFRQSQFVSLQRLKEALSSVPAEVMYDYQHTWDSVVDSGKTILRAGFDLARDLLSDDDFREVLQRRYHDLHTLAQELQVPTEDDPEAVPVTSELENVDPSFGGIAKGVEAVLRRLKIIEQEIRDLKQEIQGLRYYEHRLLIQLHHKVNYLVNYNVQMDERKVPNMFYFITPENYGRRLITSIVPGMVSLRIHMLCEFRREMHVVEDQLGCDVMQIDNRAVTCLAPYMTSFMTLVTFALRIGANWAAGMGHMIPDLGHAIAHLATPSFMAGAAGAAGAVGVAAALGRNRGRDRDIQEQEQRAAQQWLIDYLREQNCSTGKDIAEKFGLWRVRYRDDGSIAWICKRHMITRANEVIQVPL